MAGIGRRLIGYNVMSSALQCRKQVAFTGDCML